MPELPDILAYQVALRRMIVGEKLDGLTIKGPFLLRTVDPDPFSAVGKTVTEIHRIGKRVVWEFDEQLYFVFHLMIAGRFHWRKPGVQPKAKTDLAAFRFSHGTLMLTEASPKKRAAMFVTSGPHALDAHDPRGLEVLECGEDEFRERLRSENHTVKRALTDPSLFSGIGNAYSDEILHAARLSPLKWTSRLTEEEITRLFAAVTATLRTWAEKLTAVAAQKFPEKVTAFRPEMAVHGKFGQPCPDCGTAVQRIVHAENEINYCPRCQTGGKVLADRSLSRLLKGDWPKTVDELELRRRL